MGWIALITLALLTRPCYMVAGPNKGKFIGLYCLGTHFYLFGATKGISVQGFGYHFVAVVIDGSRSVIIERVNTHL